MQFTSYEFMLFFPIVLLVYFIIPVKLRQAWLLVTSMYFYMCWNVSYVVLIVISILITFACGMFMENKEAKIRKLLLVFGLISNFAILFFFKYFNFSIDTLNNILGKSGAAPVAVKLDVLLPVGISFYTFQAVGYMIDVYRGDIKAEKNILKYALFVSFFPQLVAGPIERSKNMLGQITDIPTKKIWDFDRIKSGAFLMVWGYFLKMVIADRVSILADEVFDRYYVYGTLILFAGAVSFSLQIYCDFMSYSIIAIGASRILGINLMDNFDTPYFAISIKDFWHRWHISLSTWFRDYLYIPLGGSRCSKPRKYLNIMITFLVSGLWHGANFTFIFWGGLHGLYQVIGDVIEPARSRIRAFLNTDTDKFSYRLGQMCITYVLVVFAWIFFRAQTIQDAFNYIGRMFTRMDSYVIFDQSIYQLGLDYSEMHILVVSILALIVVGIVKYVKKLRFDEFVLSQGPVFQGIVFYVLVMAIVIFGKYGPSEDLKMFLYFQF